MFLFCIVTILFRIITDRIRVVVAFLAILAQLLIIQYSTC
jgi:hypothetical protein